MEVWTTATLDKGTATRKDMQEAVGILVFVDGALVWDRPFFAPWFISIHTGNPHTPTTLPLFAVSTLRWLRSRIRLRRSYPCRAHQQWLGAFMRVDANAEGMHIAPGGCRPVDNGDGTIDKLRYPGFSVQLAPESAPWAFHKGLPYKANRVLVVLASIWDSLYVGRACVNARCAQDSSK